MEGARTRIVEGLLTAFERFPRLDSRRMIIAFSGGKDSLALAMIAKELGRDVMLRAVDMGYSSEWSARIRNMACRLDFDLEIVDARRLASSAEMQSGARNDLGSRLDFLDNLSNRQITPCTNCYNCKVLSLTQPNRVEGEIIYFAHHSDDMISSFLKNALMYYDRHVNGFEIFDRDRFRSLARSMTNELCKSTSNFMEKLTEYIVHGLANTQEPAIEEKILHGVGYTINRPLIIVQEADIRYFVKTLGVPVESSGCGHSLTAETRTPREVVHLEMLPELMCHPVGAENAAKLKSLIIDNFDSTGRLRFDVRSNRDAILGSNYRKHAPEIMRTRY